MEVLNYQDPFTLIGDREWDEEEDISLEIDENDISEQWKA